jgi:hypothetical protein
MWSLHGERGDILAVMVATGERLECEGRTRGAVGYMKVAAGLSSNPKRKRRRLSCSGHRRIRNARRYEAHLLTYCRAVSGK